LDVVDRAGGRHDVERAVAATGALRKLVAERMVVSHRRAREQRCMQIGVIAGDAEQRGERDDRHGRRDKERKANEPFAARADGTPCNLLWRFHRLSPSTARGTPLTSPGGFLPADRREESRAAMRG
jgi:hypothetical protein